LSQRNRVEYCKHIRKIRARIPYECSLCSKEISIGEVCFSIINLPVESLFSSVNVCMDCFFPRDWVDNFERVIRLAERKELDD